MEAEHAQEYFVLPLWSSYTSTIKSSEAKNGGEKPNGDTGSKTHEEPEFAQCTENLLLQVGVARATSTNTVNTISSPVSTSSPLRVFNVGGPSYPDLTNNDQDDSQIPALMDIYDNPINGIFINASYDDEGTVADFTNLETTVNCFLYGTIDEEVYVSQPPGFVDPKFPKKVYKVVKALYGLHQLPKPEILKKFDFTCVKTASAPIETQKPLTKDEEAADVDVTPKTSYLNAVKRIFRYLKAIPKLGLWYPRVSSFDLGAYSDSDYAGANLDRKSTIGGC
ncbi:putative ribonuclease H-like domain-containing protein [Tanacetum coccineum]